MAAVRTRREPVNAVGTAGGRGSAKFEDIRRTCGAGDVERIRDRTRPRGAVKIR
jgi:hypothetical protein